MRHHQSAAAGKRQHTDTELSALTADDYPWSRCFSDAEHLALRHAPFHIHGVVFNAPKIQRESQRSSVQRQAAAPGNQPASWKHTARLRWHSVHTRRDSARLLCPADCFSCRTPPHEGAGAAQRRSQPAGFSVLWLSPSSLLGVYGCERRTDRDTCYFPIAD